MSYTKIFKHIKDALKERNKWNKNYRSFRIEYATERYKELEERATELLFEIKQEQWREFLARQGKVRFPLFLSGKGLIVSEKGRGVNR